MSKLDLEKQLTSRAGGVSTPEGERVPTPPKLEVKLVLDLFRPGREDEGVGVE